MKAYVHTIKWNEFNCDDQNIVDRRVSTHIFTCETLFGSPVTFSNAHVKGKLLEEIEENPLNFQTDLF